MYYHKRFGALSFIEDHIVSKKHSLVSMHLGIKKFLSAS